MDCIEEPLNSVLMFGNYFKELKRVKKNYERQLRQLWQRQSYVNLHKVFLMLVYKEKVRF